MIQHVFNMIQHDSTCIQHVFNMYSGLTYQAQLAWIKSKHPRVPVVTMGLGE